MESQSRLGKPASAQLGPRPVLVLDRVLGKVLGKEHFVGPKGAQRGRSGGSGFGSLSCFVCAYPRLAQDGQTGRTDQGSCCAAAGWRC